MSNKKQLKGVVCGSGIDYIAFTMLPNNVEADNMKDWFELMQTEAELNGDERKTTNAQGYDGWRTTHLSYGVRHDGYWFRASGDIANRVGAELLEMRARIKPTRIDVQVTLLAEGSWGRFASAMRTMVRQHEQKMELKETSAVNLIETPKTGDTCYIGSRKSTRQFRGYDKTAEQRGKIPGQQYRLELQLTQQQARSIWIEFYRGADFGDLAKGYVSGYLIKHGLYKPWKDDDAPISLPSTYDPTSDERRLNWFLNQVVLSWWKIANEDYKRQILTAMGFPFDTPIPDKPPQL